MAKKMAAVSPEAPFAAGRLGIPGVDRMGQQAAKTGPPSHQYGGRKPAIQSSDMLEALVQKSRHSYESIETVV
jgi:hypothetical protein